MNKKILIFGLVFLFLVSSVSALTPPTSGLSYWNFSSTTDLWGSNDGTNNGATSSTSYPSFNTSGNSSPNSFSFDGTDDYLEISNLDTGTGNDAFSVSFWINHNFSTTTGYDRILYKQDKTTGNIEWYFQQREGNNKIYFGVWNTVDPSAFYTSYVDSSPNTWEHFCGVFDGTRAKIYKNGVYQGSSPSITGTIQRVNTLFVGARSDLQSSTHFNGKLDELKIYNKSLNVTEITNLYNFGNIDGSNVSGIGNFTVSAKDTYTNNTISNFSVNINGTDYYTSTGTITTTILFNDTKTHNITIFNVTGYYNRTYNNYNVSAALEAELYPIVAEKKLIEFNFDSIQIVESETYNNYYYGEFNLNETSNAFITSYLDVYSLSAGEYLCKIDINGSSYGSDFYLKTEANKLNSIKFISNDLNLAKDKYNISLKIKKINSSQPDLLVSKFRGFLMYGNNLDVQKGQFTNTKDLNFSFEYIGLDASDRLIDVNTILFLENNTDKTKIDIEINGINYNQNTSTEYLYFDKLINVTDTEFNLSITSNSTTPINYSVGYFESIELKSKYNYSVGTLPLNLETETYLNLVNFTPKSNSVFVKTSVSFNSTNLKDISFKLFNSDKEYKYTKSVEGYDSISIYGFFNTTNRIYFQALGNFTILNYNISQESINISEVLTNELEVYAFDNWRNESLKNYSVWVYNTKYNSNNGTLKVYVKNGGVDFILGSNQNGGYVNKSYSNFNSSYYLNASLYQTNITIRFKHLTSNEEILKNVQLTDEKYNYSFIVNSTNNTFNLPLDLEYLIFNTSNYVIKNESINLTLGAVETQWIYLSPIVNFSIYDEDTGGLFNLSSPESIRVQIVCSDESILEQTITDHNNLLNLTCDYEKIRFTVFYSSGDSYYRTYPNIEEVFSIDNFNFRVWLLNLNETSVIYNSFNILDLFADYDNPKILIYKQIRDENYLITGDSVDVEQKISAFLIQNTEYTIKIISDNQPERNMGSYFADLAGESTIRLFEISLESQVSGYSTDVSHYIYLTNESNVLFVRGMLNDTGNNIEDSTFIVKEYNDDGTIICSQSSESKNVEFSCNVNSSLATSFFAVLTINLINGEQYIITKVMKKSEIIENPFDFEEENTKNFIIFFLVLVIGFTFTLFTSRIGTLLLIGFVAFLKIIGWFSISNISYVPTATNTAISSTIIMVSALITLGLLLRRGQNK